MRERSQPDGDRGAQGIVFRIEYEILYVLARRGKSQLGLLLVLLQDEFPEAEDIELGKAIMGLWQRGWIQLWRAKRTPLDGQSAEDGVRVALDASSWEVRPGGEGFHTRDRRWVA